MLSTPLGTISIFYDDEKIPYQVIKIDNDEYCPDLSGRYLVQVNCKPDGTSHTLSCVINKYKASPLDDIEPGENLELKSFYKDAVKLSIGMEGDICYLENGFRTSSYDYDNDYLCDGVSYVLLSITKTCQYKFGIAWINKYTSENENQTWHGADPSCM